MSNTTPAPTDALLPCPFCGSNNVVHYEVEGRDNHSVECCDCMSSSQCKTTKSEAFAAWNRRAQPAASPAPVVAREPLTDAQIMDEASHHGFIGSTVMLVKFVRGIEATHGITSKEGDTKC